MDLQQLKNELLLDEATKAAYEKDVIAQQIAREVFRARSSRGMSQSELAVHVGMKQSAIARLERGRNVPSLDTLQRIAEALGMQLLMPRIVAKQALVSEAALTKDPVYTVFTAGVPKYKSSSESVDKEFKINPIFYHA